MGEIVFKGREGVPSRNPNPFLIFQGNFALTKGKQGLEWLIGLITKWNR